MNTNVWLPLRGPNDRDLAPKACVVPNWNDPSYRGIKPEGHVGWIGLRLDDHIVVDCDDEAAKDAWLARIAKPFVQHTWVRRTPHGYHFIYERRGADAYTVTSRKLTEIAPKLELKTGVGHQIVYRAPGYEDITPRFALHTFDTNWLPPVRQNVKVEEEWSDCPDGLGDNMMISFAGKFREWGMDEATIQQALAALNPVVFKRDPMPTHSLRRLARQAAKWDPEEPKTLECLKCGTVTEYR